MATHGESKKGLVVFVSERSSWKRLGLTVLLHLLVVLAVLSVPRRPATLIDSRPLDVRLVELTKPEAAAPVSTLPVPSRTAPTPQFAPLPEVPVFAVNTQPIVSVTTEDPTPKPQPLVTQPADEGLSRPSMASIFQAAQPPTAAPDPSAAPTAVPVRHVDVSQVSYLHAPQPQYPLPSRRAREEGRVEVQTLVDALGAPQQVRVARSSGFDRLDAAALVAVRAARFKPHTENGVPRAFWVVVPVVFEMDL
jgi:periplasmic protein TonB